MTKRKQGAAQDRSVSLTARERRWLEAVRRDMEARYALRFLAEKARFKEEELFLFFVEHVWMSVNHKAKQEPGRRDFQPEEVLRLAARIRKTAQAILRLNSESFWDAKCPATWDGTRSVFLAFEQLPYILGMYERSVGVKAKRIILRRRIERHPKVGRFQDRADKKLLEVVRRLTGRGYREKVAAILRILNPKAGLRAIEGESLRKREQRERRQA